MGPLQQLATGDGFRAWYGALGAIGAWVVHFSAVYWWMEGACDNETATGTVEPVVLGLTALLAGAGALAGVSALLTLRAARSGRLPDPRQRLAFMGMAGAVAAIVFTFAIVLEGIQVAFLDGCAPG